jgi:hypothetical protein
VVTQKNSTKALLFATETGVNELRIELKSKIFPFSLI